MQEFLLTQSSYYSHLFNTAIFFDPFRIYFNNSFESVALDLYYHVQKHFAGKINSPVRHYYILMYPDASQYTQSFARANDQVTVVHEGHDIIIGIRNAETLSDFQSVLHAIELASSNPLSSTKDLI
ncbi:MAG: hypothetical protein K2Q26_00610 [Bdellovibrionales bacterium]|nr:hypothetical protein [Bdellovibrionales bacterium]